MMTPTFPAPVNPLESMLNRNALTLLVFVSWLLLTSNSNAEPQNSFKSTLSTYFGIPAWELAEFQAQGIPEEHLPVVLLIAEKSKTSPRTIVEYRLQNKSWMWITHKLGLSAKIYYSKSLTNNNSPYGKALGYFKRTPKDSWISIRLDDREIVLLSGLKVLCSIYNCTPDFVVRNFKKQIKSVELFEKVKTLKPKRQKPKRRKATPNLVPRRSIKFGDQETKTNKQSFNRLRLK